MDRGHWFCPMLHPEQKFGLMYNISKSLFWLFKDNMKCINDSSEREIRFFTNLDGKKKKLARKNHIQTVSRVDDYDQTFNSIDETSRTILPRWKNQWLGGPLRIPTGKITWEHNDNITAAALRITVNSSRLHWQRVSCLQVDKKSSWETP